MNFALGNIQKLNLQTAMLEEQVAQLMRRAAAQITPKRPQPCGLE